MKQYERDYLKYRPIYGYKSLLISKPVKTNTQLYKPSKCVENVSNILPSKILNEIDGVLININLLQQRLEKCLEDEELKGIKFTQYKNEFKKNKPDYTLINTYEHTARTTLEGNIQTEFYSQLKDISLEMTNYKNDYEMYMYKSKSIENKKRLDEDKAFIDNITNKDISNSLTAKDINNLNTKSQINYCALQSILNTQTHIKNMSNICYSNLNNKFNGEIRKVISNLNTLNTNTLINLKQINTMQFNNAVQLSENDILHNNRLNSNNIKSGILKTLYKVADMKCEAVDLVEFSKSINTNNDNDIITDLVDSTIVSINYINDKYDKAVNIAFNQNRLDMIIKTDMYNSLSNKKELRQYINMLSNMITEKVNNTFDIDEFIKKYKLEDKGTLCTK